ncbi:hypothetical protein ABEW05_003308 [Botrytis cinerea]
MNVSKVTNSPKNVGSHAKAPEDVLNYNILKRFQKYFLPQREHFMRTLDLGRKVKPKFIFDVNPYCLEDLPEFIVEVGFKRWRLDEHRQPIWKLCRSAFFAQDPLTFPHSQFIIVSSEHALDDQIIQRLYCDRYKPFSPKLNGQYIKQNNKRTIVAIATSDSPLYEPFDQRLSGEKYDPDYRDLCWARVWKLKRGPPDRSLAKRIMDAERLALIKEARCGLDVLFATND